MGRIRYSEYELTLAAGGTRNLFCEDIGLPAFQTLPIDTRVVTGLFQGVAVRASGFQIVAFGTLAPALQYVFCFPLCVRLKQRICRLSGSSMLS